MVNSRLKLLLTCGSVALSACGGGNESSDSKAPGSSSSGGKDSQDQQAACVDTPIPWLGEGNFWQVAWSEIDTQANLLDAGGDYDLGSYNMQLGKPTSMDGMDMFPIVLDGDTQKYTPLWDFIGTDGCGNVFASDGGDPVLLFKTTGDEWTGRGFWTDFAGYSDISINRNASIAPSEVTSRVAEFDPPLTAVGYSDSESGIGAGSGCEYFEGYGTICGSDDPGGNRHEFIFEYWDDEAGPVALTYAYKYNSGGSLSTERFSEQRIEVWFFGDVEDNNYRFEHEPDSYVDPTPLVIPEDERIQTMFGEVNSHDMPAGAIAGVSAVISDEVYAEIQSWYPFDQQTGQTVAEQIHDWYSFEIVDPEQRIEFYLVWDEPDIELELHWFSAPDDPTFGFLYFGEDYLDVQDAFSDFAHVKGIPNPTTAGSYLLGVRRVTESQFATQYGIFVLK